MAPDAHLWEHPFFASSIFADTVTLMRFAHVPKPSLPSIFTLTICKTNLHTKYHIKMRANSLFGEK
jgi:hypothetical protein